LTQVSGSPFATGATSTIATVFSPNGRLLAVTSHTSAPPLELPSRVSVFSVGSGGVLTAVSGSPFATDLLPFFLAFSPNGKLLAVPGLLGVSVFSVAADGALTPVNGSPFASSNGSISAAFSPGGRLLATANIDNTVSVFSVGWSGTLTQVNGSPFAVDAINLSSIAFSPRGRLLAVSSFGEGGDQPVFDNRVFVFSVAWDGTLTPVKGSPFTTGDGPGSIAFSPSGKLLATANSGDNTVSVFSVGSRGALTQVSGSPFATGNAGFNPNTVAFSAGGRLLAVANFNDSTVSVFRVHGHH
jgi:6-phosphogluconolactonase